MDELFGISRLVGAFYPTALVVVYLYVYACWHTAYIVQYVMAVLVRAFVLAIFSAKHLRGLYVLGGIVGGLMYMLAYNLFPYFAGAVYSSYLLGASASVLAIVIAVGVREPNYPIQLMFVGTVKLKQVAIFMLLLDLLFMTSGNAGGHIAHLGGALAGWWFAAGLQKGHDATKWINNILDFLSGSWKPVPRKPKMKVHYSDKQKDYDFNTRKKNVQRK